MPELTDYEPSQTITKEDDTHARVTTTSYENLAQLQADLAMEVLKFNRAETELLQLESRSQAKMDAINAKIDLIDKGR